MRSMSSNGISGFVIVLLLSLLFLLEQFFHLLSTLDSEQKNLQHEVNLAEFLQGSPPRFSELCSLGPKHTMLLPK